MTAAGGNPLTALYPDATLTGDDLKSCCAAVYGHPAVRWLLGDELHPGGEETTRLALRLAGLKPGERLLDVASGAGASALLAGRDFGAHAVGVEYGEEAVDDARTAASEAGLERRVSFVRGDAEELPVADSSFDVVLCECSLCTFPDKERAVAEFHRVLRPGGRLALSDVVIDDERLPEQLHGALATIACVGAALPADGYERLLSGAGFTDLEREPRQEDAARFAERIKDRLRGARLLGGDSLAELPLPVGEALDAIGAAREAISDGALGYAIFSATRR